MDEHTIEVLPGGNRLEAPPTSEHFTTAWSDSERTPICDGFRVDGKREHQRVR